MLDLQKVKQLEILALCQLRRQLTVLGVRDTLECEEPATGELHPTHQSVRVVRKYIWIRCQKRPSPMPLKVREVFMAKPALGIRRIPHVQQSVPVPNGKALSASRDERSEYPALPDLTPLRALSQEWPSCKMALIRRAWPDILVALKAGHSLKRVCELLREDGILIGYNTLCSCASRLRRERR
jgi:hypothetical protein